MPIGAVRAQPLVKRAHKLVVGDIYFIAIERQGTTLWFTACGCDTTHSYLYCTEYTLSNAPTEPVHHYRIK